MAFDGNGNYVLPTNSFAQPVTGTAIDDTGATALWADLATALSLCTTNDGQTSSPTLTNPKILTKVLDTNGNEVLEFGPTGSAVNHVKFINAATGNAPSISAVGDDTNIDLELTPKGTGGLITPTTLLDTNGNEWVTHVATGSAVNNVRITNAATGNAAKIDVTETNTDLELAGNGTGKVLVDGLYTKVINIGDWNMDSTATVNVAHGLTLSKIRSISAVIRDDTASLLYDFSSGYAGGDSASGYLNCDGTNVNLQRESTSTFDGTGFDSTGFNRGWITIQYTS